MIIICEDNGDQRLALRLALEQAQYTVREAADGREAMALQRSRPAEVLITDIFMPESDGFELIDAVKKEFPATKVAVISGGGSKRLVDYLGSAQLIGADATLQKPFEVAVLLQALKELKDL